MALDFMPRQNSSTDWLENHSTYQFRRKRASLGLLIKVRFGLLLWGLWILAISISALIEVWIRAISKMPHSTNSTSHPQRLWGAALPKFVQIEGCKGNGLLDVSDIQSYLAGSHYYLWASQMRGATESMRLFATGSMRKGDHFRTLSWQAIVWWRSQRGSTAPAPDVGSHPMRTYGDKLAWYVRFSSNPVCILRALLAMGLNANIQYESF